MLLATLFAAFDPPIGTPGFGGERQRRGDRVGVRGAGIIRKVHVGFSYEPLFGVGQPADRPELLRMEMVDLARFFFFVAENGHTNSVF